MDGFHSETAEAQPAQQFDPPVSGVSVSPKPSAFVPKSIHLRRHLVAVAVIGALVFVGSSSSGGAGSAFSSQPAVAAAVSQPAPTPTVDEVATIYIASNVATELDLPLADQINKKVASIESSGSITPGAEQSLEKPQMVNTAGEVSHTIRSYVVKAGDSLKSVAQRFNLNADTIAWSNNLQSDSDLLPNTQLRIPPVNGVLYTVRDGDTAGSLASQFKADASQIISFNDLELSGFKPGQEIMIPGGLRADAPNPNQVAAFNFNFTPTYSGNGYDYGWCTWWAANRRAQIGRALPSNWGDAINWRANAAASGYRIGSVPEFGAVVYHKNIGGLGHVAFVEQVTSDGAWFSDMNYPLWGQETRRFVKSSEYDQYAFIY